MQSSSIIPEETVQLAKALGEEFEHLVLNPVAGATKTVVEHMPPKSLGMSFQQHKERGRLFEQYAAGFKKHHEVFGTPPAEGPKTDFMNVMPATQSLNFPDGFFRALVLTRVFTQVVHHVENASDKPVPTSYSITTGTSRSESVSLGMNVELSSGFAGMGSTLGFSIEATFSHQFSREETREVSAAVDPNEAIKVYQLGYQWTLIKAYPQKYPDGKWVMVLTTEDVFTEHSSHVKVVDEPLQNVEA